MDEKNNFSEQEIHNGRGVSILSYFGILALIPLLTQKDNRYTQFHAKQGLTLLIVSIIYGIVCFTIMGILAVYQPEIATIFIKIFNIGWFFLAFINISGVIFAIEGKARKLPIIRGIKIFK